MTPPAKLALALWGILAVMVFSVTFDWKTRMAGHQFVRAQAQRRQLGVPLETIDNGFRPMVRAAALESAAWPLAILAGGTGAVLAASRRDARTRV